MLVPGSSALLLPLLLLAPSGGASPLAPASPAAAQGLVLSDFIRHFEPARYDRAALAAQQRQGERRRRAAGPGPGPGPGPPLRLTVTAGDRELRMLLLPDTGLFAEDAQFEGPAGPIAFDPGKAYVGWLEGQEQALVQGVVTADGLFDGSVSAGGEQLFLEPAGRYLRPPPPGLHSVLYSAADVRPPASLQLPCASQLLFLNRTAGAGPDRRRVRKRAAVDPTKTTCMLYLQADHFFHEKYGSEEACIEVMTRHVQRVNAIYRTTDFNQDGRADNISFMIKRIKVHTRESLSDPSYRFPLNYGVEKFLELFSEEDYDAFCLAYMFTYRDFEMGTLGLAWTGDLKNAGGVCEKNGLYRGSMKSLNTGIVTLLNYGKQVPPAVSHVTLAHEIGHNFGSPHDPDQCTPGGEDGNFIMFARATSGDKRNNNKFSQCSLNSINPVLNAKARSPKGCFTEPQAALCGNGVVEVGEECDCGWEEDCRDRCCHPQRRHPPPGERPCSLAAGAACSPSQGPCCTPGCELKFGEQCREDNGCRDPSYCNGRGPACPPSVNKPNKTVCNDGFVCFMGECTGSICLAYGLESCQCLPGPRDPSTKACELCCKEPGDGGVCKSSFEWNTYPLNIPDMYSKPGTPCNNYNGYCDVFQKCREVDPSGPLATLRKLLLSDESIASFKRWLADHWYAALLAVLGFVFLLVVSTRLLGKRPTAKLKAVTIIHSSTTETVRLPPEEGSGPGAVTVHPVAVRCKLPLKHRMREARDRHRARPRKPAPAPTTKAAKKKKGKAQPPPAVTKPVEHTDGEGPPPATAPPLLPASSKGKKAVAAAAAVAAKAKKKAVGKKKKAVIDYSAVQEKQGLPGLGLGLLGRSPALGPENDPVGKVKNWLLNTHQAVDTALLPKSKSTPVELTAGAGAVVGCPQPQPQAKPQTQTQTQAQTQAPAPRSPVKARPARTRPDKGRSLSAGNLQGGGEAGGGRKDCEKERVRLQVVYKPPFKFSLKLRRPGADKPAAAPPVMTAAAADRSPRRAAEGRKRGSNPAPGPRTALLLHQREHRGRPGHRKVQPTASRVAPPAAKDAPPLPSSQPPLPPLPAPPPEEDADSNLHTVPSDLEVLLSESEFLFSDA